MLKYQHYDAGDDNDRDGWGVNWMAQTFTTQTIHLIAKVKLKLFRVGDPGTVIVSIKATTDDEPSGADLCSGEIEGNVITEDGGGDWYEISLGDGFTFNKETKYAIVVKAPDGDTNNKISWRADITDPTYARGYYCVSSNSGESWDKYATIDCMFEEWGVGEPAPTTVTWGQLSKSQISAEKIETAITRLIEAHNDDSDAHIGEGRSLNSHKAAEIIDHLANSIVEDKLGNQAVSNPKIKERVRGFTAVVDAAGNYDYETIQAAIDYVNGLGGGSILILNGEYRPTSDIIVPSNIRIVGESMEGVVINFDGDNYQVLIQGSGDTTPSGTITATEDSNIITGTGTAFTTEVEVGKFIRINDSWYEVTLITDDTHLRIFRAYQGVTQEDLDYDIADFKTNINVEKITIKGSADGVGLKVEFVQNSTFELISAIDCDATGIQFFWCYNCSFRDIYSMFSGTFGIVISDCQNCYFDGLSAKSNASWGIQVQEDTTLGNVVRAPNSSHNGEDGLRIVGGEENIYVDFTAVGNKGNGVVITACSNNEVLNGLAKENGGDGIKTVNGSHRNRIIGNATNKNGGNGIFISNVDQKNIVGLNHAKDNFLNQIQDNGIATELIGNVID